MFNHDYKVMFDHDYNIHTVKIDFDCNSGVLMLTL